MKNIMFVYAFDRELLDNENAGIKSYQALWMRIQNEIVGERFNRFADMVDMDRLAAQEYTPDVIVAMSECMAEAQEDAAYAPLDRETAGQLIERARMGAVGIPLLIRKTMQGVDTDV